MKKISVLIFVVVICCLFSSCDVNISSVDVLMRPPKLSGENSLLQQTFESTVGNSKSVVMKTPVSGENRSSYLLFDLDKDSVKEALVLYSDPIKDDFIYISIFKFVDFEWSFVSTIKGASEEIYAVDFADINGDSTFEILISWSPSISGGFLSTPGLGSSGDKMLTIYDYDGKTTNPLINETYTKLLIEDLNNDYADELFFVNISLSNQEKISIGRIIDFNSDYSINNDIKFTLTGMLDVHNIVCDTYSVNDENHTRVYIDGSISESGIITEVIDIEHSSLSVSLPFHASNISAQPLTLRDVRVFSQDFDNDGIVEVPLVEKLYGGLKVSATTSENSALNLTVWNEINNNEIVVDTKCLWNGTYGYMFIFPEDWIGKYTAIYNENDAAIMFYTVDDNETLLNEVFSIKATFEPDWEEDNLGYIKFDENGVYVFGYSISEKENNNLYINIIENNFILINQE